MSRSEYKGFDEKEEKEADVSMESAAKELSNLTLADSKDSTGGGGEGEDMKGERPADLQINWMNMKDASTGRLMWRSANWGPDIYEYEKSEHLPKAILQCRSVSREINFSSRHELRSFHIEQYVYLHGHCIEQWSFHFGFVMPGSTNTWQQVIAAAAPDQMLDPTLLSGNVTFETHFFDGDRALCKSVVRLHYD